ncbi:MAG: beta-ketoacyl synthase N-terminal-like domain-containing protein [Pseudomonadota bacterium]
MQYHAEDIAIVGMAGLYPKAETVDVFWSNILDGVDAVTTSTDGWLGIGDILDPESDDQLRLYSRRGGFLGDLARFDPIKNKTMPLSLLSAQPDQFIALKLARDALVDAGMEPGTFDGTNIGVVLGHSLHVHRGNMNGIQHAWINDQLLNILRGTFPELTQDQMDAIQNILVRKGDRISSESIPGLVPNIMTGRIANRLDLMGPNYIIDAACSSSLIAVDHAITELRTGRADAMIAGGVNTTTSPLVYSVFSGVDALSPKGFPRPFSTEASGTVLGEGAGLFVLKRLSDAIKNDDRVHSVIKGVGQSSDGRSSGLMAPRMEGEVLAMKRAYKQTEIDPLSLGLLEAHGTGIPLGDRTEVSAMREIFGGRTGPLPTIPMGSVKSMIGHCIPASGSAAIIKMTMALKEKIVPPTLCAEVSPELGLEDSPFYISQEVRPWTHSADHPRRAGINAFGFGGINAHMVLEEAPGGSFVDPTAAFAAPTRMAHGRELVVAFAAPDRAALLAQVDAFAARLADTDFTSAVEEAWTTVEGADAGAHPMRLAVVASDAADYTKKIDGARAKIEAEKTKTLTTRNGVYFQTAPLEGKVAFLFPGEMAQYPGMMQDVAQAYPAVREWFDFIGELTETQREVRMREVVFPPMNLVDEAGQAHLHDLMHRVDYGSEMVFAADQAVFGLLSSLGVKADAMLGHSTGENAAIVASGMVDWERKDVGAMIARMNEVFAEVEVSGAVPSGALLTIAAFDNSKLPEMIASDDDIHFTMDNCPNQSIVFGPTDKIDALEKQVVDAGAVCTRLPISWGYHTEFVRPMAEEFGKLFQSNKMADKDGPVLYSCSTAKPFPKGKKARIDTAIEQYVTRVRFREAIENLYEDGHRIFIECGPNANLTAFVGDTLGRGKDYISIPADNPRRGMASQLRHVVARLFAAGRTAEARDFLFPPLHADNIRRAAEGEGFRKEPLLNTDLTTFVFSNDELAEIRAMIDATRPAAPARAAAPAPTQPQMAAPAVAAAPVATPTAPAPAQGMDQGMLGHFGTMSAFMQSNSRVVEGAVGGASGTGARQQIAVMDLGQTVALPFEFSAYMLEGAPSPKAVLPYLSRAEQAQANALLESAKSATPWQEWSLSRLAVKFAAVDVVARGGVHSPQNNQIEVLKHADGRPYLGATNGLAEAGAAMPSISISHVAGRGVGAAAPAGFGVGVDFEMPERLADPVGFLDMILGPNERRAIQLDTTALTAATLWAAKEASAKALGVGLQGRPDQFPIVSMSPETGQMCLNHGDYTLAAQTRAVGNGVFAVAYIAAAQ